MPNTDPGYEVRSKIQSKYSQADNLQPTSSPDVLTGYSPDQTRGKQIQEAFAQVSNLSSGGEKRKQQEVPVKNDPCDHEKDGSRQGQYVPRSSKRRSRAEILPDTQPAHEPQETHEDGPETADVTPDPSHIRTGCDGQPIMISSGHGDSMQTVTPEPPQPKKRGRKKKSDKNDNDKAINHQDHRENSEASPRKPTNDTMPPVKRKRGRPKKGTPKPPSGDGLDNREGEDKEESADTAEEIPEKDNDSVGGPESENAGDEALQGPTLQSVPLSNPRARERKKIAAERYSHEGGESVVSEEKEALKDISNIVTTQAAMLQLLTRRQVDSPRLTSTPRLPTI